ncbi:hypothetical protein M758_2G196100 [Ceratodon purpureus]|nr:hypothetical protein M758_2G196100 [Ceratodon purpureus]
MVIKHLSSKQERDISDLRDAKTRATLVLHEELSPLLRIKNENKQFGCSLELVTNASQNGSNILQNHHS